MSPTIANPIQINSLGKEDQDSNIPTSTLPINAAKPPTHEYIP